MFNSVPWYLQMVWPTA